MLAMLMLIPTMTGGPGGRGEPWWINWLWQLLISHSRAAAIDVVERYSFFADDRRQKDCVSQHSIDEECQNTRDWGGNTPIGQWSAPLCIPDSIWPPAGRLCACFYPNTHHVWGLRSHWCFWLNCLFPQTWIQSSTPETSRIVGSIAATTPPPHRHRLCRS